MTLENHNIYLVGIKGVGMTSLATYLQQRGKNVWGSDLPEEFPTDRILKSKNISVLSGFNEKNISDDIDLVITTGAHGGLNNPEVLEARKRGKKIMTQAEEVGHIMKAYETGISVCGSHGKTTTSSLLAFLFKKYGLKASHVVGAPDFTDSFGGEYNGLQYFVAEADEYVNSPGIDNTPRFLFQHPKYIVSTNIEYDHPDVYPNIKAVEDAFRKFFTQCAENGGSIIYNADQPELKRIAEVFPKNFSYGQSSQASVRVSDIQNGEKTTFNVHIDGENLGEWVIDIPGNHNVMNTAAVIAQCHLLGLDLEKVKSILPLFKGAKRRFEKVFEKDVTYLFDDYAHHPTEISALIQAARSRFPKKRILLVFQPHTYSRTQELFNEFIHALTQADRTYIFDIFGSAREQVSENINSRMIAEAAHKEEKNHVNYLPEEGLEGTLSADIQGGDVIITAGAGDIYKHHPGIIKIIAAI